MQNPSFGIPELPYYQGKVDEKIKAQITENIGGMQRFLQANGKRYRPSLVIVTAFYGGKTIDDSVINAAAAVELVHIASLVHDDIMDGGTLRWGEQTISSKEGEDMAILAGDYLIAKGCALASRASAEAGEVMAETVAKLCIGQAIELNDSFNTERTVQSLLSAISGKTSSMFAASCVLGGVVAGLDEEETKVLSAFGEKFGIAYQYLDDVRDFVASPESTGKSVGNDIREGNYTLPVILSLNGPNSRQLKKLLKQDAKTSQVLEILVSDDAINRTIKEAENYKRQALAELQKLKNPGLSKALKLFTEFFLDSKT